MSVNKVNTNGSLSRIAGGTLYADAPIGTIIAYGGANAPSGWLLCQGQAISRTDYADLFKAIGTAFGTGDGSTTFNIPDLRESVPKGVGLTGNSSNHLDDDGLALGEFIGDRIQNITGSIGTIQTASANGYADWQEKGALKTEYRYNTGTISRSGIVTTGSSVSNQKPFAEGLIFDASRSVRTGATTEVKAIGVNYIIKAKQAALPTDISNALDEYVAKAEVTSAVTSGSTAPVTSSGVYSYINAKIYHYNDVVSTGSAAKTINTGIMLDSYGEARFAILDSSERGKGVMCVSRGFSASTVAGSLTQGFSVSLDSNNRIVINIPANSTGYGQRYDVVII